MSCASSQFGRTPGSTGTGAGGAAQSQQKWDVMFDVLVEFIEETRVQQTAGMSEEQRKRWVWDG